MHISPRFALIPFVMAASAAFVPAAGAQTAPEPSPFDACATAFDAPTDARLAMATNPAPRSDVRPGAPIALAGTWAPTSWESLSSVLACVRLADTVRPDLSASDAGVANDGTFDHSFAVPEGLFNGTVICTRMSIAGNPVGDALEAVWVGKQACFEVHPEETPTTSPPATPPTTAPSPTAPPAQAPPRDEPAGSGPVASAPAAPTTATPSGSTTPAAGPAPSAGTPAAGFISPAPAPRTTPVAVPILPVTGFAGMALAGLGLGATALGLAARSAAKPRR